MELVNESDRGKDREKLKVYGLVRDGLKTKGRTFKTEEGPKGFSGFQKKLFLAWSW